MAQRRPNRKAKKSAPNYKIKTSMRQKLVTAGVVFLALLFVVSMFFSTPRATSNNKVERTNNPAPNPAATTNIPEPQFVKEGSLQFLKNEEPVKTIDIEIADNPKEIEQGLMFRKEMAEDRGMLFLMPELKEQSFWMKNTIIPLDIIYLDPNGAVVSIQKNAQPFSEQSLPSYGLAQYVLEVNAGFTDKYGIKKGDRVKFEILN